MTYEWDELKARRNLFKHGITFADAAGVFEDPRAMTIEDPHPNEERFLTLGRDLLARVMVVAWTWRGANIRLISARPASRRERREYTEG